MELIKQAKLRELLVDYYIFFLAPFFSLITNTKKAHQMMSLIFLNDV